MEQALEISADMAQTRRTVRAHLRDTYAAKMADLGGIITRVSDKTGMSLLATGHEIAKQADVAGDGYTAMLLLAATVELVDPTPAQIAQVFE